MQEGSYTGPFDVTHADTSAHETGPTLVSRETQLANVHLMFASMFAGCVITLIVVAMLMEFCNFTRTRFLLFICMKTTLLILKYSHQKLILLNDNSLY